MFRFGRFPRISPFLCFFCLLHSTLLPLSAWKSVVHVHLALIAQADAVDDGMVTLYEMDYESGRIMRDAAGHLKVIGTYPVDPAVLSALRAFPDQYKAGAVGPDAYPDIITGQSGIHPDNRNRGHAVSNDWLKLLWEESKKVRPAQVKAFTAGFLAHAAGDLFGHTFVNNYSGGPFEFGENALKHIVLESYIDKRTPTDFPDFYNVSIDGAEDFIYKQLVIGPLIPPASESDINNHPDYLFNYSLPRVFKKLREFVFLIHTTLDYDIEQLSRQASAKLSESKRCSISNPSRSSELAVEAAADKAEQLVLEAVDSYVNAWLKDIVDGQKAWPAFSHEIGKAALFNPAGFDRERIGSLAEDFFNTHLLSMLAVPDAVGETLAVSKALRDYIDSYLPDWLDELIRFIRSDFALYLLEKAWGQAWHYLKDPEVNFDMVLNNGLTDNRGERISLREFNHSVLKIQDSGYSTDETYDWTNIPAMVNTVTMTKLLMVSRSGIQKLIDDMEEKAFLSNGFDRLLVPQVEDVPVILNFMQSLDDDNQWCIDPGMLFARDPCAYKKLFVKQTGEDDPSCLTACSLPEDGSVTQAPYDQPLSASNPENILRDAAGNVWMWGHDRRDGAVGRHTHEIPDPVETGLPLEIASVSAGDGYYAALAKDGTVWIWGNRGHSSYGFWGSPTPWVPLPVPNLARITQLSAGRTHLIALRSNGTVWSWGDNDGMGALGQGPGYHRSKPPRRVRGIGNIVRIDGSYFHCMALTADGEVWAWGNNGSGQLGDGTKVHKNLAVKVPGLNGIKDVAAGNGHSLALKSDGTVWAWGWNKYQQLGDGTKEDRLIPVQVAGLDDVISVSAGWHFSSALRADGTVWVWGSNNLRPLGQPRPLIIKEPARVPQIPKMNFIDAGFYHMLGRAEDGSFWIWGGNRMAPVKIESLK